VSFVAHHPRAPTPCELHYLTIDSSGERTSPQPLPDAFSPSSTATLDISVIVPAYNERDRLPTMLSEAVEHLYATYNTSYELLIVDDGSKDDTVDVALSWSAARLKSGDLQADQLRVISLSKNRGKGGAVTHGMRHIRGKVAIFADADGATKFADLAALSKRMKEVEREGYAIAVGSRAHMVTTEAVVKRSWIRNLLMYSFHTLLKTVGVREVRDTQCGFKLFSRKAAQAVFEDMRTEGWIFDIEVLLLARYKGIPVVEVPVSWHEVEGTKLELVKDSVKMAWDLGVVRMGYAMGVYSVGRGGPGRSLLR
jgi:dolichyl-phosphate beta-glucosyltransferase